MRQWSLHARVLTVAMLTGLIALAFAAVTVGQVLERFVVRGLDRTLDTQIVVLGRALSADGRLDRTRIIELPGFADPAGDWSWRVQTPAGDWRSGDRVVDVRDPHDGRAPFRRRPDEHRIGARPAEGRMPDGERVHLRVVTVRLGNGGRATITVGAPRRLVERPLRAAQGSLLLALGLVGLAFAATTVLQLRFGLRPVRTLRDAVARVRAGDAARLPVDQPSELKPLVDEVNALIDQNQAGLENARRHVANLAHGLKTPLATLSIKLANEGASADARALVEALDTRIAHHLRRARAAAPSAGGRARTALAPLVGDLIHALGRIHVERGLTMTMTDAVRDAGALAVERQDLEEVLGNLLDNACRHARSTVAIGGRLDGPMATITIDDDGPGLAPADIERALRDGVRLDESEAGYGFGLGISRELIELYGGRLLLARSDRLGGLCASVSLPR